MLIITNNDDYHCFYHASDIALYLITKRSAINSLLKLASSKNEEKK